MPDLETGLFAVVGDVADREVEGLLVPYGELSRTSMDGVPPIRFAPGTVAMPADPSVVTGYVDHDRHQPVARALELREQLPEGIVGRFAIARTPEGDAYLADPTRRRLSPELAGIVRRGADGIRARLTGAGFVTEGAFASAGLFALGDVVDETGADDLDPADPDDGEVLSESSNVAAWTDEDGKTWTRTEHTLTVKRGNETTTTTTYTLAEPDEGDDETNPEGEAALMSAPATGFAAATPTTTPDVGLFALARAIVEARRNGNARPLDAITAQAETMGLFALADQTYDKAAGDVAHGVNSVPQYLTDIWEGDLVEGLAYSEHFDSGELTDLTFKQRAITQRPLVTKWTGNKSEIPSQAAKFTTTPKSAQRFAGGLDIAREHYDFGKVEDVALILQLMGESYRLNSERYIGDELRAAATTLEVDAATRPAGVSAAHHKLVRGALAVLRKGRALPTVAFVADDLFDELLLTPKDSGLEYLTTSLNLAGGDFEQFRIVPDDSLAAGEVLVGARKAVQVLTLPGSPIRVNALDIARGGVDEALFGYVGVRTRRAEALQLVTDAPAA